MIKVPQVKHPVFKMDEKCCYVMNPETPGQYVVEREELGPIIKGVAPIEAQNPDVGPFMAYTLAGENYLPVVARNTCKDGSESFMRRYYHTPRPVEAVEVPVILRPGYATNYPPAIGSIELGESTLIYVTGQKNMKQNLEQGLEMLHQIEKELHLVKTKIHEVEDDPYLFLVEGSKRWRISGPMINAYIFLIRNLKFHKKGQSWEDTIKSIKGTDTVFIVPTLHALKHIVKNKYWKVFQKEDVKNYLRIPSPGEKTSEALKNAAANLGIDSFGRRYYKELLEQEGIQWIWPEALQAA